MKPQPKESLIQSAILAYLSARRIYAIRVNSGRIKIDRRLIKLGDAGTPDIIACVAGAFIGFEVKSATGKVTELQAECHERIARSGGVVFVVRSVDDVRDALDDLSAVC